ncbi:hypothetical protein NXC24_PC01761 (plasmid) [Rhizobium sp. NXC24]|nr:hypothetical protein NXC24_PC01761 [Rhizobium sp. NXC24]
MRRDDQRFKESNIDALSRKLREAKDQDRSDLRRQIEDLEDQLHDIRRNQRDVQDQLDQVARDIEWFQRNPDAPLPVQGY